MTREGVRPNHQEDGGYDHWKDPRFRGLAVNVGVFFFIAVASGKLVEYVVDKYVVGQPNAAKDLAKAS